MKKLLRILPILLCVILLLPACSKPTEFSYSGAFNDKGYWKGVTALDYVTLCDLNGISVPSSVHNVSEFSYYKTLHEFLASAGLTENAKVTDRAVVDGDTVNIDYVGRINGVAFGGGSTGGAGTDVTIGVTSYIDDFLEQLIGHMPGETFNVEVTFPDNYGSAELNGKDAVFETTINYITDITYPEITDEFAKENFADVYGWDTAEKVREGIIEGIRSDEIENYINDYLIDNCTISSLPKAIYNFQVDSTVDYYETYAEYYDMELNEFMSIYVGYDSIDALIEASKEANTEASEYYLIVQAIAEKENITVSDADLTAYFVEYFGTSDYSSYEESYGVNYLKWITLSQKVLDHLTAKVTLLD